MNRKGLLIPRKIYNDMGRILFQAGLIPIVPELRWTTNKDVYGYLQIEDGKYSIYINKMYCPEVVADFDNYKHWSLSHIKILIDSCGHEYMHLLDEKHDVKHKKLTRKAIKLFLRKTNITCNEDILEYIKDCKKYY